MKYRNIRTGNMISIKSGFSGPDWVPVQAPVPGLAPKVKAAPAPQKGQVKKGSRRKKAEYGEE